MRRTKQTIEFGDFQTPSQLAERVCSCLSADGLRPVAVVEPTCGRGAFVVAALKYFPDADVALGVEINPSHVSIAKQHIEREHPNRQIELRRADFFDVDWEAEFRSLPQPTLVVGNPPWVTSARVGALAGSNLPTKSNFLGLGGMDAKTGKSNFDISEWMTIRLLESAKFFDVTFALLLKTSAARRVLSYAWSRSIPITSARLLRIDSTDAFGASADAGVLVFRLGAGDAPKICRVADWDDWNSVRSEFGMRGDVLAADVAAYERTAHLRSPERKRSAIRWRSGLKHDCAAVMELHDSGGTLLNRLGEPVDVESRWVYPLLKGSSLGGEARRNKRSPERFVIVPQQQTGDDTSRLSTAAPRLWTYLTEHGAYFDRRRSSIYKGRARFSVFGVGSYTFRPWKVAICGLYKHLRFALVGPRNERPVVLDDTCYHLSFDSEEEAKLICALLESETARDFFEARVFWDAKRPITVQVLQQLDLLRLADELGRSADWDRLARRATLFDAGVG